MCPVPSILSPLTALLVVSYGAEELGSAAKDVWQVPWYMYFGGVCLCTPERKKLVKEEFSGYKWVWGRETASRIVCFLARCCDI